MPRPKSFKESNPPGSCGTCQHLGLSRLSFKLICSLHDFTLPIATSTDDSFSTSCDDHKSLD